MKIGIIGGGIAGLSAAYELSKKGHEVTVFSKDIGGLAKGEGKFSLEPFYHHFFKSDTALLELINDLNLTNKLLKKHTPMGFYINKKLYPFTTPIDLLRFKPLNIQDRIKAGLLILYFQHKKKALQLDKISIEKYLQKNKMSSIYEKVWKPLLTSKFTIHAKNIPALWLWGRIHPRSNSRENGKEYLYYPKGSFNIIFEAMKKKIILNKGQIIQLDVKKIQISNQKANAIIANNKSYKFDLYIAAIPNPLFQKITNLPNYYSQELNKIKYQSAICMTLFVKKNITNYYWININDNKIPFAGLIEHTNFVDKKNYNNQSIIYLFNYIHETHELNKKNDEDLFKLYLDGLKKMFPNFDNNNILSYKVSRAKYASPVYDLNYLKKTPKFSTPIKNLYLLNTSQIYPEDRNVNNGIVYTKKLIKELEKAKVID